MSITVYSNENCRQCDATKRFLKKHEIPFREEMLADHPDVLASAKEQGAAQAPIVVTSDGNWWSGLNMGNLKQYKSDREHSISTREGLDEVPELR